MKLIASNINLIATKPDPDAPVDEALEMILSIINTEMELRGYSIKVSKTKETSLYEWEPDKKPKKKILLICQPEDRAKAEAIIAIRELDK